MAIAVAAARMRECRYVAYTDMHDCGLTGQCHTRTLQATNKLSYHVCLKSEIVFYNWNA